MWRWVGSGTCRAPVVGRGPEGRGRRRQAARERPGAGAVAAVLVSIVVSIPACHAGDRGSIPRRGGNTPSFGGWRRSLSCRLAPKGPSSPPSALRPPARRRAPARAQPAHPRPPPAASPSSSPGAQSPGPSEGLLWTPQAPDDIAARPKWLSQWAPCVATHSCAAIHSGIGAQLPGRVGGG